MINNYWFFISVDNGVDAAQKGDISTSVKLYDDGTAISQFPGAGITQFNLAGTPLKLSQPISVVPNPMRLLRFQTLPV
ncbi:hypothetical protein SNE25_15445 [Mucilaginibacter sabulilitoris]|uniref:Uncharacterized protein n=1 Tax=Mucilaginibacter sabulilitoris TaxID=1173583 RepID=A0ABZ0TUX8_9SPHI|nr:hypothetical protein [Mucilaginibacter sabulilitoris]WPU96915.1 hypothetical protein SNE25_15445 [Mucilaginibacter sabulilitoris]